MKDSEMVDLLSTNGKLIKRPIAAGGENPYRL